ncbi:ATP phosphoribosyltransferase regulatory subunit [Halothiobacillus sp. DCM-1]|uniref:ATP phosphoribosyltransferase regulatory subunit n=1 Tax=Halothiobacillus sp. DCM-1 TaxID=3112558 RepID=UPI00324D9214
MSHTLSRWALPAGIDELLPDQARRVEALRARLLAQFAQHGYQLVIPPIVEFVDSLLVGAGRDLALDTLTMTDGVTGRSLGLRADMTPQIARIDAHSLPTVAERRLCYLGTVVRARPDGLGGSRTPMQVGAELYGVGGVEGDLEIIELMLDVLRDAGVPELVLDLGHVDIFGALAAEAGLTAAQEEAARDALQRKSRGDLLAVLQAASVSPAVQTALLALLDLNGVWNEVLPRARAALGSMVSAAVRDGLDRLNQVAAVIAAHHAAVTVLIDLAELHGYHYQTGLVFAAYARGVGRELARGGRYDDIGAVFGRARPATGFSTDVRELLRFAPVEAAAPVPIYAPADYQDTALRARVAALRAEGRVVVMTAQPIPAEACQLVRASDDSSWQLIENSNHG